MCRQSTLCCFRKAILPVCLATVLVLTSACAKPAAVPPPAVEQPAPSPVPTIPAPALPTLSSPANNSTVDSLVIRLEWNPSPNATAYGLQVSSNPDFTTLVIDKTGITITSYNLTSELSWGTSYY